MGFLKKFWREICLILLVCGLYGLFVLWTGCSEEDVYARSFIFIGMGADIVAFFLVLRSLWRKKWRKKAAESFGRLFERIRRFMTKIAERLSLGTKQNDVLRGRMTFTFDKIERDESELQKRAKPPKWKQLEDDRSRMRYLYRGMIKGRLKRGELIYSDETPSEIERKKEKTPAEQELFDMYIACRYDERKHIDEAQIQNLKRELEIK